MAGVRGFPGRGRRKFLGLFFPSKHTFPLKTHTHTHYKGMMACCPKCYCDDAAFKASIDADIKTGSEAPYNCKDLKCGSTWFQEDYCRPATVEVGGTAYA